MPPSSDSNDLLREYFRKERRATGHPSPERLAAYQERRLPPEQAEELRAHFADCPDCTAELLALIDLVEAGDASAPEVSPEELEAAWERQKARSFPRQPVDLQERRSERARSPRPWTSAFLGLAAALLAVVALVQWRTIVELRGPQANPPLVNLAPLGSVRQEARSASELRLPPGAKRAWVILNPVGELDFSSYDVEIFAPDGGVALRFEDIRSSEAVNFRLEIPRGVLREGNHRIVLFGEKDGSREMVEEYELTVRLSPSALP